MEEDNSEEKVKQAGKAAADKVGQVAKNTSKKALQKTKQLVMKLIATHFVQIAIVVAIVAVVIIILAAICYFIKIDDGSHQDGNWSNTGYVVSQKATSTVSTTNITGDPDSGYTLGIDLDAKVEEVLKTLQAANGNSDFDGDITNTSFDGSGNNTRLAAYLSEKNRKQYLKDFIKAEIVTQYPDLRKNPDEELPENELQGVIKVKRAKSDGNTKTLRYVDEENFNSYVELYNQNGDTKAADYFTLNSSGDLVVAKWNKTTTTVTRDSGGDSSPDTKDPSTNQDYNVGTETKYTMTTTSINYKSMVEQYTMPFDFIWALLVMTEDEEFAHNVSKLALDSEIVFTVNDNKTTTKTEDVYTYKKQTKTKTTVNSTVTANVGNGSTSKSYKKEGEKEDSPINYKVTKTVTEEDTNPVIDLTYADTWIAEYKNNYSNKVQEEKVDKKDPVKKNNIDYKKNKEDKKLTSQNSSQDQMLSDNFVKEALDEAKNDMKTNKSSEILENELEKSLNNKLAEKNDGSYKFQIANDIIGQLKQKIVDSIKNGEYSDSVFNSWNVNNRIDTYKGTHKNNETVKNEDVVKLIKEIINSVNSVNKETAVNNNINGVVDSVLYEYYRRTTNQEINTTITTNGNKYTQGTPTVTEKTDKEASEENFITLFNKSDKAKNTLTSTPDWFFEMLENSPSASDMVDIVKYLLFKATGKSYGVEEFDFSEYEPNSMTNVGNGNINMSGGTVQEKVWNALVSAGFSEYATAGVMGNINGESGFNPEVTEIGSGIGYGLCQWSYGRRDNLEAYANSKGALPSDVNIQIEFLLGDLGVQEYVTEYNETNYLNTSSYKGFGKEEWKNATSPENAAKAYCWWYERPAAYDSRRETWAKEFYNQFHGKAVSGGNGDVVKAAKDLVDSGEIYYDMPRTYAGHYVSNFECVDFTMEVYYNSLGIDIYGIATSQGNCEIRNVKGMYNYLRRNQKIVYTSTAAMDTRNNDNIDIDSIAKPGDIIGYDYYPDGIHTWVNPGFEWDHVNIYIGNGQYANNGSGPANYGTLDDYRLHSIKYIGRIINY